MSQKYYITPDATIYPFYKSLLEKNHLLIAGTSGSGKSVLLNNIITTALINSPYTKQFILIDPKQVELYEYEALPHTIKYACEEYDILETLDLAIYYIEKRFRIMKTNNLKVYDGSDIYVIVDELADLMVTIPKLITPKLQRIAQLGRAAKVHLILATQCPLASIIPTAIKVNFDTCIGLHTRTAQDSRNIIGEKGCERLPLFGQCLMTIPTGIAKRELPLYSDDTHNELVAYWLQNRQPMVD